jgi:hypothetical protein
MPPFLAKPKVLELTVTVAQTWTVWPVTDGSGAAATTMLVLTPSEKAGVAPTDRTTTLNASANATPTAGFRAGR